MEGFPAAVQSSGSCGLSAFNASSNVIPAGGVMLTDTPPIFTVGPAAVAPPTASA